MHWYQLLQVITDRTIFSRRQRLRKDTRVDQRECIPLLRALRLEVPEHPALSALLVGLHLRLDVAAHVVAVVGRPVGDLVVLAARADLCRTGIRAIEAGANAVACNDIQYQLSNSKLEREGQVRETYRSKLQRSR